MKKNSASLCTYHSVNEMYDMADIADRFSKMDELKEESRLLKILVVGAGSYIGTQVEHWLKKHSGEAHANGMRYEINTFDTRKSSPTVILFTGYDVIFHVAGIAHRKGTKENARLYYLVNRDLAIKTAKVARKAGVKQFIILSTMSVYGLEVGRIDKNTKVGPKSHYGRSKAQADEVIWKLTDENFRVVILRPPMVYGKDCKGNYQKLRWLALHIPVFPKVDNKRSMIYIGNLCAFIQDVIDDRREGIFFPQNKEYVNTTELVERIAITNGRRVKTTRFFNWMIKVGVGVHIGLIDKVFGSLFYEEGDNKALYNFDSSVSMTEIQIV